MINRTQERFGLWPQQLAADAAYGSAENLAWLVHERGIEPHIPVFDHSQRTDGTYSRDDFTYDHKRDCYICPAGNELRQRQKIYRLPRPHMGVIRSRGFVPSFSPFVSDPKSEPSVIRPGLPVLVSTSHTVAARRRSYQNPAYGRAGAQEDETNLSFGPSRPEGRGGRPLGSAGTDQSQ